MKLLESRKMTLPIIYFVSDRSEVKDIPVGVPFMYGDAEREEGLIRILEYEVLYQAAIDSGFPFDFRQILKEEGYMDLEKWGYGDNIYYEIATEGVIEDVNQEIEYKTLNEAGLGLKDYIRDSSAYVDIRKLKDLNVFPVWLETIEKAVHTNIHNFAVFNNNMYNKKLEGMYGGIELVSPSKNLIIIDISSSIPRAVSSTCLTLAKSLAETFYADLIITGSETKLYDYEEINQLDVERAYDCGMGNEGKQIRALLASDDRHYKTVICFCDNDAIGCNFGQGAVSDEDGKKLCTWTVDKLISFHTRNRSDNYYYSGEVAGYARWFSPTETEKVKDWVKYLK